MRVKKTAYTKVRLRFLASVGFLGGAYHITMSQTAQDISDCQINKYNMFYCTDHIVHYVDYRLLRFAPINVYIHLVYNV